MDDEEETYVCPQCGEPFTPYAELFRTPDGDWFICEDCFDGLEGE